jgi:hypothetical protein
MKSKILKSDYADIAKGTSKSRNSLLVKAK